MVLWVVGMGLNLPDFSCRTIWYAILATRGLWEVIGDIIQGFRVSVTTYFDHFVAPNVKIGLKIAFSQIKKSLNFC